ncbi:hypothetical protein BH23BAC1_BH23BAC1_24990 [soil metagenome]
MLGLLIMSKDSIKNFQKTLNFIFFLFLLTSISANGQNKSINEEMFLSIGGIEQWVTINGKDITKPAILFLHGGPGSVMTPYYSTIYGDWEKDFILVNWDQRGAGRTFGRNAPSEIDENYWIENPLTVEEMIADGIELAEYLIKKFNQQKIFCWALPGVQFWELKWL